jgi:LacI family transcriptional regulator
MSEIDKINIKQLAKELNVSPSTISRAFRGYSDINQQTKERILTAATKLNYQPNIYASNLREMKSKNIAVIIPEIANNFFSQAIDGLERITREKGYNILIFRTENNFEKQVAFINQLNNGSVDGVIMSACGETDDHEYLRRLLRKNIPVVFFDRVYDDIAAPKVTTNDYESSFEGTRHLIACGCKRIAHLVIDKNFSLSNVRMEGYRDALQKCALPFDKKLVLNCGLDDKKNYARFKKAFQTLEPDGIFASVERLAFTTYQVCQDLKIAIPQQVKILSFSSLEIAPLLNPALTTITQPAYDMGNKAALLLFKALEQGTEAPVLDHIILKSKLVKRASTAVV